MHLPIDVLPFPSFKLSIDGRLILSVKAGIHQGRNLVGILAPFKKNLSSKLVLQPSFSLYPAN